jgi:amidohydrolase
MSTNKQNLKDAVCAAIDARRAAIVDLGQTILRNPELGFKESETAQLAAETLRGLGLAPREQLAITGVKAVANGSAPGPTVAILGEMDALINYDYPFANPTTGAAHCCGHHAQVASMLGAAMGLLEASALNHLAGNVAFMAVPAEEFIELDYRLSLRKRGQIEFLGGKQELIRLGAFDDVDMAMISHSAPHEGASKIGIGGRGLAFVAKHIRYSGKTAHAALAPHRGVNALNAALLGLMGIHAQRETFTEEEHVRIHPIITRGGDVVNAVPDDVTIETYVRAATTDGLLGANQKVDRALQAGAMALGAQVCIENVPGYLPINNDAQLSRLLKANGVAMVGEDSFEGPMDKVEGVSGDIGDVGHLMPAVLGFARGWSGHAHSASYVIEDQDVAYVLLAKAMAMTVVDLLWNGAEAAQNLLDGFVPSMTKDQYLAFLRGLFQESVYPASRHRETARR